MALKMKKLAADYDPNKRLTAAEINLMCARETSLNHLATSKLGPGIKLAWKRLEPHIKFDRVSRNAAFRILSIGMVHAWKKGYTHKE